MLGGLALKWRWRERHARGRQADRPAEPGRWAPTSRSAGRSSAATGTSSRAWCRWRATATTSTPPRPWRAATRTRSASSAILGSTFDGSYEPVKEIAAALDELAGATRGLDVPDPRGRGVGRAMLVRKHQICSIQTKTLQLLTLVVELFMV